MNERRNVPTVEGAITAWGNTRPVEPARSRSTWSIWEPPTSIDDTNVRTLRPGFAPPTRPPSRTVPSTKSSNPNRSTNVPAANKPASATSPSSSKTTPYRSILCDTPLTGSASRLQANLHYCLWLLSQIRGTFRVYPPTNPQHSIGGSRLRRSFLRRPPRDSSRTRRCHRGDVQHRLAVCDEPLRQMTAQAGVTVVNGLWPQRVNATPRSGNASRDG